MASTISSRRIDIIQAKGTGKHNRNKIKFTYWVVRDGKTQFGRNECEITSNIMTADIHVGTMPYSSYTIRQYNFLYKFERRTAASPINVNPYDNPVVI